MVIKARSLVSFALIALAPSTACAAHYYNDLYGYCITVPAELFPQGEADAHDGQVFLSRDARVSLRVWGQWDMEPFTFAGLYRETARDSPAGNGHGARVITYTLFRPTYFVISGLENSKVFYQRTIYSARQGAYATFLLEHPKGNRMAEGYLKQLTTSLKF